MKVAADTLSAAYNV